MGTNYYLETKCCPACKRPEERLHIGKSSAGWCFSLHVTDTVKSLDDWRVLLAKPDAVIVDEYGETHSADDMLERITGRFGHAKSWAAFDYAANHAEPGPNNLARHKIDGRHCVGHGKGTWDLITGEFF